jgi:hypothetical protein
MSPEQVRGAPPDGRSDLFSLSVVLYELLLGQKPFGGDSVSSVLYRIVHEEPADPGSPHPRLAPPVATFLRRALAKAPEARPPDGETFATELRRAAKTPDGTVVSDIEGEGWEAGSIPPREEARPHGSNVAFWGTVGVIVLAGAAAASWYAVKGPPSPPPPPGWVSTVRTEPPGLPVYRDGEPLAEPEVRFAGAAPFPVLTLDTGCRTLRYEVTPEDAGREIVLVPDPTETPVVVESDHEQASVILNGEPVGSPGVPLRLDLCRENRIELAAEGYRDDSVSIPAGATPLEARTAAASLSLDPLPTGTLVLTDPGYRVRWSVNGEGVSGRSPRLELSEGRYRIRAVSEPEWVDVTADVTVKPNETVTADLGLPRLGRLRVQAFPANARVYARRGDSPWRLLDDAPLDVRLAVGAYRIRVEFLPSGKRVEKRVEVRAVDDPPVRVGIAEAE